MLEVARVLTGAKCFQPDFTTFFVAFDTEEGGSYGSLQFLRSIIVPNYIKQGVRLQVLLLLICSLLCFCQSYMGTNKMAHSKL